METSNLQRILGVDPGTLKMGYGVIESQGGTLEVLTYGVLRAPRSAPLEERLGQLFQELLNTLGKWSPTAVAVEEPFVGENPRTSLAVGRSQAIVLLAAHQGEVSVSRYSPAEVKASVTDYGRGSKEQVQAMIRLLLGIAGPLSADAADALAVALCHLQNQRLPREIQL